MTVLYLTACMMARLTAACLIVCSYQQTSSSGVFLKTLSNKLNVFQESIYLQQRGVYFFLVSTAFISVSISFAAVSITLHLCRSWPSGLGKL